jgi:hypothetical protein
VPNALSATNGLIDMGATAAWAARTVAAAATVELKHIAVATRTLATALTRFLATTYASISRLGHAQADTEADTENVYYAITL